MMKKGIVYIIGGLLLVLSFIFDKQISAFFFLLRTPFLDKVIIPFEYVFHWAAVFVFISLLFYFTKKKVLPFWLSFVIALAVSTGLKYLVWRVMPAAMLIDKATPSFPSAHTTAAFTPLAFFKRKEIWLVVAVLVGLSRLYLGVHYASDVVFGALLGYSAGLVVSKIKLKGFLKKF